jgi:hypothetical protein
MLAVCLVLSGAADHAPAAEWGNLTGRIVYDGDARTPPAITITKDADCFQGAKLVDEPLLVGKDGGVANVVVYVRSKGVDVHPDYENLPETSIKLDNHKGRFEPRIVTFDLKQPLVVSNSDACAHNSNCQPLGDTGFNPLLPSKGTYKHTFSRQQNIPIPVSCNIHPWMKGYVLPRENPYATVSAKDGTFTLENLPVGELEFQAWQEKAGYLATEDWPKGRFKVTIKPGVNSLGTIKLEPALFEK